MLLTPEKIKQAIQDARRRNPGKILAAMEIYIAIAQAQYVEDREDATVVKQDEILKQVADEGLFIVRLNNGNWMAGKGTHIYHLEITQDHYADPNVSISPALGEAVAKAVEKLTKEVNHGL